jgi:signal transduction histidine kinase
MDDLIDQVLTLAREGNDISETQEVHLDSVAERAWAAVDFGAADLCLVGELGRIEADPDRLQEAFENLFRNAVEHAGEDVTVRVGRSEAGFYVEDDGPGIPSDRRESVFERGNSSNDGTGLGLSIVQSIVEAHGWSIHVAAGSDAGARFDVTGAAVTAE